MVTRAFPTPWTAAPWPLVGAGYPPEAGGPVPSGWAVFDADSMPILETSSESVARRIAHAVNWHADQEARLRAEVAEVSAEVGKRPMAEMDEQQVLRAIARSPAPRWDGPAGEYTLDGQVLKHPSGPVAMVRDVATARELVAELNARDLAALPAVLGVEQRIADLQAEQARQVRVLERQLAQARAERCDGH